MKLSKKLSPAAVEAAKPEADPYRVWDTVVPQLHLRVQPSGIKSWNVQWSRSSSKSLGKWPGVTVESARTKARTILAETDQHGAPLAVATPKDRGTVSDACREYVAALRKDGRESAAVDAERRFDRTVHADKLGRIKLANLHEDDVTAWRDRIEAGDLPDLPVKKGRPPKAKPLSKSSVNRVRTMLVAALNHAVTRRKVSPERAIEWTTVKPLKGSTRRRELYLDRAQRRALLAHAGDDLRDLMTCIALTGCRPGDPAAMLRKDYDARHGTATFRTKGHTRTVPLSPDARALFKRMACGKLPTAPMFTNAGKPWRPYDWAAPVRAAAEAAELPPGVVLYTLRHCWITDAIVGGMDLLTVAKLAGTSLAMIEKHYGHLVQGAARDKLAEVSFL